MKEDRLRITSESDLQPDTGNVITSSASTCRRRSFSVTPKGGLVNEGDELLAASSVATEKAVLAMVIQGRPIAKSLI